MIRHFFLFTLFLVNLSLSAQTSIYGEVTDKKGPIPFASIELIGDKKYATTTTEFGKFKIENVTLGEYKLVCSFVGYKKYTTPLILNDSEKQVLNLHLTPDLLQLEEIVVSATRGEVPTYDAPVIVNKIDRRTFEFVQAQSLSDGLSFSPGLRVENNCQNCGFTQVRMNGMEGPYTQLLINSRPVFSALAGVYGLEMIPPSMIDRVEIVKGGGSALYGGNAIAGTINIITNEPIENTFEIGLNQAFTNFSIPDRTVSFTGSLVNKNLNKGISFYGFNRMKEPFDANKDGFSELTKLRNNTLGFDAYWNTPNRGKLKLNGYSINEFRRGGNKFNLQPHQTDITEQLDHNIIGGGLAFDQFSKNYKHKISIYGSIQSTNRSSYYGGGGRVISPQDTLTESDLIALNAYGSSTDLASITGLTYTVFISDEIKITTGTELQSNQVKDKMDGYARSIEQSVNTIGSFGQIELDPTQKLRLVAGGRIDVVSIKGKYKLEGNEFENNSMLVPLVPRLSVKYDLTQGWKLRASYAQGYRAPQAFDEDLHIETVGGAARFTLLDPNLETERSNNFTGSVNYTTINEKGWQWNLVAEGFYTRLNNPFIFSNQIELPSGVAVITKRNGSGATVQGINLEGNVAFSKDLILQVGATIQENQYDQAEVIWEPENQLTELPIAATTNLLRTPNNYGFFTVSYSPINWITISNSGTYTGSMDVPHIIDAATEQTVIKSTPQFFDWNFKVSVNLGNQDKGSWNLSTGIQNILNSYQKDFDKGAERDAGYVYGPLRPRTIFFGLSYSL